MIKPEELRINNWIKSETTVFGETREREWQVVSEDFEPISNNPENYNPIPLNEEWLLKFGFVFDGYFNNSAKKFTIEINGATTGVLQANGFYTIPGYSFCKLHHVHQLQNLFFALTGEELTIK